MDADVLLKMSECILLGISPFLTLPCLYKIARPAVARLVRREPVGDSVCSPRAPCPLPRYACTDPSSPTNWGPALASAPWA